MILVGRKKEEKEMKITTNTTAINNMSNVTPYAPGTLGATLSLDKIAELEGSASYEMIEAFLRASTIVDSVLITNTTPHCLNFQTMDGTLIEVPSSKELLVNATPQEVQVNKFTCTTTFVPSETGTNILSDLNKIRWILMDMEDVHFDYHAVVGSMIAAQAYPEQVVAICPAPGFERVAPPDKRMLTTKFTVYPKR